MPIDNNINETVVWRNSSTGTRAPVGPVLQRYGDFELHYSPLAEAAPPPLPPIVDPAQLSPTERLAFAAFQLRHSEPYRAAKLVRPRDKETWDMKGCIAPPPPEALSPVAGARAAATMPTSGWLEGSVAVGTIMVNGPTNDLRFTDTEQTKVVAEVQAGLSWLAAQALSSRVTFVHDIHLVQIDTAADATATDLEGLWRNPTMSALGYGASWQGVIDYVQALRERMQTQWAYVVFFVKYPLFHFAYASLGGPRLVMQYANDGWGPDNIDRVFAHETGHIFGCPDEYTAAECTCDGEWGRFLEPNRNCATCAGTAGVSCLMRANDWTTCQATRIHLGWSGWAAPILAAHSNLTLDVSQVSTTQGAGIIQWPWHGGGNQRFLADPLDDDTFRLVAEHSGLVLDVAGASMDRGAKVVQWPWHGGGNQRFRLERQLDGTYRIIAKHSGLVLDVKESSTANGAEIIQWSWHGGNNQRFRLLSRGIAIQAVHSGLVLDVRSAAADKGADLIQWPLHGGANQRFRLDPLEDGNWRILAEHSGLVLDIAGASTERGAKVIQWPWHGGNNQRFRVEPLGDGTFRIVAVHTGLALDITKSSLENRAELIQWTWYGGPNQRFKFS